MNHAQASAGIALCTTLLLAPSPSAAQSIACAPHTPGGVVITEGRGGTHFAIAAGTAHQGLVTWVEHHPWANRDFRTEPAPSTFLQRAFDTTTMSPQAAATQLFDQGAPYEIGLPLAAVSLANGGAAGAYCTCYGGSARTGCSLDPVGPAGAHPRLNPDFSQSSVCPQGSVVAAAVGADVVVAMPCPDCGGVRIYSTAARREHHAEMDGEIQVPAIAAAGADHAVFVRRAPDGIEARMFFVDGRSDGRAVTVSEPRMEVGAPAVLWSGSSAWVVYAQRRRRSDPWQLGLATWTPGQPPTRSVIATGTAPAMGPALAPAGAPGCFVLSWTEGTGHTTVARVGRVCNGILEPASVAQLSQPGIEAGDSELASDGTAVYAVWQELPGRPATHEELRIARLGCR